MRVALSLLLLNLLTGTIESQPINSIHVSGQIETHGGDILQNSKKTIRNIYNTNYTNNYYLVDTLVKESNIQTNLRLEKDVIEYFQNNSNIYKSGVGTSMTGLDGKSKEQIRINILPTFKIMILPFYEYAGKRIAQLTSAF
jgi:hypothetical protein